MHNVDKVRRARGLARAGDTECFDSPHTRAQSPVRRQDAGYRREQVANPSSDLFCRRLRRRATKRADFYAAQSNPPTISDGRKGAPASDLLPGASFASHPGEVSELPSVLAT